MLRFPSNGIQRHSLWADTKSIPNERTQLNPPKKNANYVFRETQQRIVWKHFMWQATQSRGGFGDERYEKVEMQKRVREIFADLQTDKWHVLDATKVSHVHPRCVSTSHRFDSRFT